MTSKVCSKCKAEKALTEFYKRTTSKDGVQRQCKQCANTYFSRPGIMRRYIDRASANSDKKAKLLAEYKSKLRCTVCGETNTCCLDFHHIDPAEKEHSIVDMVRRFSWKNTLREIEKCICVCSNCHRKIHAGVISCPSS